MTIPANTKVSALDVASYLLELNGNWMSHPRLNALVYFCQSWHLYNDKGPLFHENILVRYAGPFVRELWNECAYRFSIEHIDNGASNNLTQDNKRFIKKVFDNYKSYKDYEVKILSLEGDLIEKRRRTLLNSNFEIKDILLPTLEIEDFFKNDYGKLRK